MTRSAQGADWLDRPQGLQFRRRRDDMTGAYKNTRRKGEGEEGNGMMIIDIYRHLQTIKLLSLILIQYIHNDDDFDIQTMIIYYFGMMIVITILIYVICDHYTDHVPRFPTHT